MYSYPGIVDDLLKKFPEISKSYEEEIAWIKDTFRNLWKEMDGESYQYNIIKMLDRRDVEEWKFNILVGKQEGEVSQIKRKVETAGYLESHVQHCI